MEEPRQELRAVDVVFGTLKQTVMCNCSIPVLNIFGFVDVDQMIVFESMTPIKLLPDTDNSLLISLASSMERNNVDAVVFAERDMLIRVRTIEQEGRKRMILFLCVPKRPVFDSKVGWFDHPSFSLLI